MWPLAGRTLGWRALVSGALSSGSPRPWCVGVLGRGQEELVGPSSWTRHPRTRTWGHRVGILCGQQPGGGCCRCKEAGGAWSAQGGREDPQGEGLVGMAGAGRQRPGQAWPPRCPRATVPPHLPECCWPFGSRGPHGTLLVMLVFLWLSAGPGTRRLLPAGRGLSQAGPPVPRSPPWPARGCQAHAQRTKLPGTAGPASSLSVTPGGVLPPALTWHPTVPSQRPSLPTPVPQAPALGVREPTPSTCLALEFQVVGSSGPGSGSRLPSLGSKKRLSLGLGVGSRSPWFVWGSRCCPSSLFPSAEVPQVLPIPAPLLPLPWAFSLSPASPLDSGPHLVSSLSTPQHGGSRVDFTLGSPSLPWPLCPTLLSLLAAPTWSRDSKLGLHSGPLAPPQWAPATASSWFSRPGGSWPPPRPTALPDSGLDTLPEPGLLLAHWPVAPAQSRPSERSCSGPWAPQPWEPLWVGQA